MTKKTTSALKARSDGGTAQEPETPKTHTTRGITNSAVAQTVSPARPESAADRQPDTEIMKPTTTTTMADNHPHQQPSGASSTGKESQERNPVLNDNTTDQPVPPTAAPATVWHYTTGMKIKHIEESGELKTTNNYIAPGEKPV
ncbi:MAG: hypothetical protein NTV93_20875 [Verrucomicrobia bacterium]|nr:hypothetical protein [Verrucomicrobiota bacterium]